MMFNPIVSLTLILICASNINALVSGWGENCTHTAECSDHRYICQPDINNISKCFCDRFHKWGGSSLGCVQIYNYTTILGMTVNMNNVLQRLENQTKIIFGAQAVAGGLFVITAVLIAVLAVAAFCFVVRRNDFALKKLINEMESKKDNRKASSTNPA